MPFASDFHVSKTTWLGLLGVLGGVVTAGNVWAEKGDWKAALAALAFSLYSALQVSIRDAQAKGSEAIVSANQIAADRVEGAVQNVETAVTNVAPAPGLAVAPVPLGGLGGQMADTINLGGETLPVGGETLPVGGETTTLRWGDLPAEGQG